jgi:hypothetical protein
MHDWGDVASDALVDIFASASGPGLARAFSVPMESERRLYLFILTRFLYAKRYPLRWKTL